MAGTIPQRLTWAVEVLAVEPGDQVLEIGCGHGAAVALIGERLVDGTITAIDRSQKMVDATVVRNRAHIASGKAAIFATELARADFGGRQFNKVFAVNVNLFWTRPAPELNLIRDILAPGGVLYLFYQPPSAAKVHDTAMRVRRNLESHGFKVSQELRADLKGGAAVCLVSGPEQV